tara:strand:+ start:1481 stop:1861 length:381 start_codon:yes stop_codon:yes gene_type:complete
MCLGGLMNKYIDTKLGIEVMSFSIVLLSTILAASNISGLVWSVPLILAVVLLNLVYKADILLIDALKIALAVSIVYNIAIYIVNDTVLNLYLEQPSEMLKLLGLAVLPYWVIFKPFFAFFAKKETA